MKRKQKGKQLITNYENDLNRKHEKCGDGIMSPFIFLNGNIYAGMTGKEMGAT